MVLKKNYNFLMIIKYNLFVFFSAFCLVSAIFVIWTKNPVFSVLFLIFSFFNVSAVLFLFNFEFLPIAFLVVYVGAVAVLFLFVLMMLNIKLAELIENYYTILPVGLIFCFIFIIQLMSLFQIEFELFSVFDKNSTFFLLDFSNIGTMKTNFFNFNYSFVNLKFLGFVLFSEFLYHFVFAGFVLLFAMVGAILLTLQKRFKTKNQDIYQQILKDYNMTVFSVF